LFSYYDLSFATEDEEETESVAAHYRSYHLWFNLRTDWSEALFSQTILSSGRVRRQRIGGYEDIVVGSLDVEDHRTVDFVGLKQDWTLKFNDHHFFKAGVEVKRQEAYYDYSSVLVNSDRAIFGSGTDQVSDIELTPAGTSYAAYVADRFRLSTALVAEVGLRWDRQFYVGDHQISPRLNLLYEFGPQTTLRASWGQFYQSQRLNELQVEDGVSEFYPAQLAEHSLASVEHHFDNGLALRFEAYRKNLSNLKPRFENLFNPLEMFPEAADDRIRIAPDWGRSHGFEVLVRRNLEQRMSWWFSYVLASVEDHIDGEYVPRSWDQRHAASFGLSFDLGDAWKLNLAGACHSGWPTTEVTLETRIDDDGNIEHQIVLGPRNRERYPSYLRFDARASHSFDTRFGPIELMLEVINMTNRKNVCCIEEFEIVKNEDGTASLKTEERHWAPIIPSVGVSWTF